MGYNSSLYIHTLYQAINLAFAHRDFYYGDPYFPPEEPLAGLLSKEYARARAAEIEPGRNDPDAAPGDPYAFQEGENPFLRYLERWPAQLGGGGDRGETAGLAPAPFPPGSAFEPGDRGEFYAGTTSIQAADAEGWVVSITPSGAWVPAVIAGETGVGLSQRMQSFVVEEAENPYNVVTSGQRPRVTLTPTIVLWDGKPWVSVAVQGGARQDRNTLQFLLGMIHLGTNVQEVVEAANGSFQMVSSLGDHERDPGGLLNNSATPPWMREELVGMGYELTVRERTSGSLNAIWFDRSNGMMRAAPPTTGTTTASAGEGPRSSGPGRKPPSGRSRSANRSPQPVQTRR